MIRIWGLQTVLESDPNGQEQVECSADPARVGRAVAAELCSVNPELGSTLAAPRQGVLGRPVCISASSGISALTFLSSFSYVLPVHIAYLDVFYLHFYFYVLSPLCYSR